MYYLKTRTHTHTHAHTCMYVRTYVRMYVRTNVHTSGITRITRVLSFRTRVFTPIIIMYCAYVSIGYIKCDLIDVAPLLYVGIVPPVATGVEEPEECDPVGDDDDVFVDCPEAAMEGDQIVLYGMYCTYHVHTNIVLSIVRTYVRTLTC